MKEESIYICKGVCFYCGSSDVNVEYIDGYYYCFFCEIIILLDKVME